MPRLLTVYLIRHVLGMTAIVAMAMLAIHSFITLVTEADETGKGGFGVVQLLLTTAYQLPAGLALLLPIVAMIGTLMALGALASQGELTAMRAAGFSAMRIAGATLIAGAMMGLLGWWIADVAAPWGVRQAEQVKLLSRGDSGGGKSAVWLRDGDTVLRIKQLKTERLAQGVELYQLNAALQLQSVRAASQAEYRNGRWQLQDVKETQFDATGRATSSSATQGSWVGTVTPNVLKLFLLQADAISTAGLARLIRYLDDNQLDARSYRIQLASKLVAPFTIMAMALFAAPFAFGSLRGSGAGQRLLLGILLGVGFYVVNRVSLSLGQIYGWQPALAAGGPTVVWALLGLWRLQKET